MFDDDQRVQPRTYVIADLHGAYDLLRRALDAITERGGGTVVLTGDYIDRGPESRQIIERLMAGAPPGQRWICLKGNHEDIMLQTCADPSKLNWWMPNGGNATLKSYGQKFGDLANPFVVPKAHLDWLAALPVLHVDEHRVYAHAGVHADLELDEQDPQQVMWMLFGRHYPGGYRDKHLVHGHEQYRDGPLLHFGRTNLDTLAWLTGRLVVGVFDDAAPGGPVDLIEVTA